MKNFANLTSLFVIGIFVINPCISGPDLNKSIGHPIILLKSCISSPNIESKNVKNNHTHHFFLQFSSQSISEEHFLTQIFCLYIILHFIYI